MVLKDISQYFWVLVQLANAYQLKKESKLRPKDMEFLVHACLYKYQGLNLSNFTEFADHLVRTGAYRNRKEVSLYKSRLKEKGWIKASRYMFELSSLFDTDGEKVFKLKYAGPRK